MTFEELHKEAKHLIAIAQSGTIDQSEITREVIEILAQLYIGAKQEEYNEWVNKITSKMLNVDKGDNNEMV
jgi:hypothetical protein